MSRTAIAALLGSGEQAAFVTALTVPSSGGAGVYAVPFTGMAAGQLCLIWAGDAGPGGAPTIAGGLGWTTVNLADWANNREDRLFYKVLTSGDISTGHVNVTIVDIAGIMALAYKNATSVAARSSGESLTTDTTLTLGSFSLAANSAGVVAFVHDRDGTTPSWTCAANGLAQRIAPVLLDTFFSHAVFDFLTPSDYPEQSLTFSGFTTGGTQKGDLVELLQ